jgi:hypothetical protein
MEEYDMPERERQRRNVWPFLLLIAVLLLAGGGLFVWLVIASQPPQPSSVTTTSHFSSTTQPSAAAGGKGTPPTVAGDVKQQVAQQLRLSVGQLTTKLQSGVAIDSLAAQQGMSSDAWRAFVIATYQAAYEKEVRAGYVTQARADHDMHNLRSYPLDALNTWATNDCLGITPE